jgi:DNA replicative helicase MCM subunit Mcm2 (Cdc46/Mcm family)
MSSPSAPPEVPIYEELVDFIIRENPERYANFQASEKVRERVWELARREKDEGLTPAEKAELDTCAQIEHVLRLAKARARLQLARQVAGARYAG